MRAAMAAHYNQTGLIGEPGYPDDVLAGDPNTGFDVRALAYVVRDILDLAGLKFDVEGRLF